MGLVFPPIYLLPTHIPVEQLHEIEDSIPTLTYDIKEAKIILGKVSQKRRALLELISRQVYTEEVEQCSATIQRHTASEGFEDKLPPKKKRKVGGSSPLDDHIIVIDSSTESEDDNQAALTKFTDPMKQSQQSTQSKEGTVLAAIMSSPPPLDSQSSVASSKNVSDKIAFEDTVKVVRLTWFTESVKTGKLLSLEPYLVYEGRVIEKRNPATTKLVLQNSTSREDILNRARQDAPKADASSHGGYVKHKRADEHSQSSQTRPTHLLQQTTSEHDDPLRLPLIPTWLRDTYSCTRPTPSSSPNDPFLCELKKIKLHRKLTNDEIGVRAYSTAIATLAAYPHHIQSAAEIVRLPGCEKKIAYLYQEWKDTGSIKAVQEIEANEEFQTLNLFYEIWGCAEATAREFWKKGYRALDDIVEYEWGNLSRVQQIGLKYYTEFQTKIPRAEVESIAARILAHANKLKHGFQMCIVGGYRRGKAQSGDVDVVLTHPDEAVTANFIDTLVSALEHSGWVSHMLITTHANSERGQTPVSWKGEARRRGSGFDTLDKALLVWQDPNWAGKQVEPGTATKIRNPNVHRRVDIIISPWKTAGCAIMGWTSGTTFQRDLRRYCRKYKEVKFDSSGVRSLVDGSWVDYESVGGDTMDLIEKEKRVFRGLGLQWREPAMRCTG